jgi:hypothetical protein
MLSAGRADAGVLRARGSPGHPLLRVFRPPCYCLPLLPRLGRLGPLFPPRSVFSCAKTAEQQCTATSAIAMNRTNMKKRFIALCANCGRGRLPNTLLRKLMLSPRYRQDMGSSVHKSGPLSAFGKWQTSRIVASTCRDSFLQGGREWLGGTSLLGVPTKVDLRVCHVTQMDTKPHHVGTEIHRRHFSFQRKPQAVHGVRSSLAGSWWRQ